MRTKDKTFETVMRSAENAFQDHKITEHCRLIDSLGLERKDGKFGWWKVQKPGTWNFGYYVANMPGMVHIHGDIGDITVSRTKDTAFDWFPGITDVRYFAEKVQSLRPESNTWSRDIAQERLADLMEMNEIGPDDVYAAKIQDAIDEDRGPYPVYEALEADDIEYFYDCEDWNHSVLWGYWALRKFVDLTVGWPDPPARVPLRTNDL